ncbi:MAG: putative lipid flippase MurJ [Pseudomonadota bacterium]
MGFIRDVLVARLFGAGFIADAFFVAFRIPNLLRSFVAEGALTSAFVPVFAEELRGGSERAQAALSSVGSLLLIATAALSALGVVFAEPIVLLFAPGFGAFPEKLELCIVLTQIMFPLVICVSLIALINGALSSAQIFGAAAWAQVWMNLALILGAVIAGQFLGPTAAIVLALSVIVGGILQILTQLPALHRAGFRFEPSRALLTPASRQVLTLMIPATLGAAIYQLSIFFNTLLASLLDEGSVAWLFYADRLTQLPIGVFTVSLASVVLPMLASAEASGDRDSFGQSLVNSLRYTSFVILPLSVGTFILAEPLIKVMFERGAFTAESSMRTAQAVQALSIGLWGASCHSMVVRAFIARKDPRTPTVVSLISLILGVFLAIVFMGPPVVPSASVVTELILGIQNTLASIGLDISLRHAGLGLASSLSTTIACGVLLIMLHRRGLGIRWAPFLVSTGKTVVASTVMAAVLLGCGIQNLPSLFAVLFGSILGGLTFYGAALALQMREIQEGVALLSSTLARIRRR